MKADKVPKGWFPMKSCPANVIIMVRTIIGSQRVVFLYDSKFVLVKAANRKDCISDEDELNDFDYWQPIPGVTPAFGSWEDGPPPTDTILEYFVENNDNFFEMVKAVDGELRGWNFIKKNYSYATSGKYITGHCRVIGAVEGVG